MMFGFISSSFFFVGCFYRICNICFETSPVFLNIDLQDLSSLFDWNTKQLFVMLIMHYRTEKNVSIVSSTSSVE